MSYFARLSSGVQSCLLSSRP